ncbi:unnamed protein product, partial [Brassica napus]
FRQPETVFVRKQCCNNPVNHRVFERKLRPKPSGRGHACLGSGEASSATDRAQVPWKGAPERVRAPSCPDPVAPRGAVYESGCLGMQPQSGGKFRPRLNMGERPIANKYREGSGWGPAMRPGRMRNGAIRPPIDSGHVAALIVVCSTRLTACLGICVLRASACGLPIRPVLKHGPRSLTCVSQSTGE